MPLSDLPDQQVALVRIRTDRGIGQIMAIKIEGNLLAYFGGSPVTYEALDWVPMNEAG